MVKLKDIFFMFTLTLYMIVVISYSTYVMLEKWGDSLATMLLTLFILIVFISTIFMTYFLTNMIKEYNSKEQKLYRLEEKIKLHLRKINNLK